MDDDHAGGQDGGQDRGQDGVNWGSKKVIFSQNCPGIFRRCFGIVARVNGGV